MQLRKIRRLTSETQATNLCLSPHKTVYVNWSSQQWISNHFMSVTVRYADCAYWYTDSNYSCYTMKLSRLNWHFIIPEYNSIVLYFVVLSALCWKSWFNILKNNCANLFVLVNVLSSLLMIFISVILLLILVSISPCLFVWLLLTTEHSHVCGVCFGQHNEYSSNADSE